MGVEERWQSGWNFLPQKESTRAGSDFNSEDDHSTEAVKTKVINSQKTVRAVGS